MRKLYDICPHQNPDLSCFKKSPARKDLDNTQNLQSTMKGTTLHGQVNDNITVYNILHGTVRDFWDVACLNTHTLPGPNSCMLPYYLGNMEMN